MLYSVVYSMWELISLEPKSQVAGVTMVIDANGYGYKHFTAISMTDMKMSFKLMEVGLPNCDFSKFYLTRRTQTHEAKLKLKALTSVSWSEPMR